MALLLRTVLTSLLLATFCANIYGQSIPSSWRCKNQAAVLFPPNITNGNFATLTGSNYPGAHAHCGFRGLRLPPPSFSDRQCMKDYADALLLAYTGQTENTTLFFEFYRCGPHGSHTQVQLLNTGSLANQAGAYFTGSRYLCYKPILRCDALKAPTNGILGYDDDRLLTSTATYACNMGYELVGESVRTCQLKNAQWSGVAPVCRRIPALSQCLSLTAPANGFIQYENNHFEKSLAEVHCNRGFRLSGTARLVCSPGPIWVGKVPTCEALGCPEIPNQGNSIVRLFREHGLVVWATVSCRESYSLKGASVLNCLQNGSWDAQLPSCDGPPLNGSSMSKANETATSKGTQTFPLVKLVISFGVPFVVITLVSVVLCKGWKGTQKYTQQRNAPSSTERSLVTNTTYQSAGPETPFDCISSPPAINDARVPARRFSRSEPYLLNLLHNMPELVIQNERATGPGTL